MKRHESIVIVFAFFLLIIGVLLFLASLEFYNGTSDSSPDIIIYNGNIITMEHSPAQAEAVAIQGETILAIGDENDILAMAGSNTQFIDLDNRTLLPGFIDSHAHWIRRRDVVDQLLSDEAIETALSVGWTSITEMTANQESLDELIALNQQDSLRLRVNVYLTVSQGFDRFGNWYQTYQPGQEFSSKLRVGGVKIFMDGFVTDWIHYLDQTELDSLVQEAHDAGFQIAIHSVTDNATDIVLNSLESVLNGQSNALYRHRIEHLVLLRNDQIQRMSDLEIIASFQLTWFNSDDMLIDPYPIYQEYSSIIARWRDIIEAEIPSIGSTDYPFNTGAVGSALKAISLAVTKIGKQRLTPPNWMLRQSLSVEQALRLLTIDAAYGTFQEDIKGSIKVGKLADLVILSDNPLTVPEDTLADIDVLMTMVGGVVEYTAPGHQFPSARCVGVSSQPKQLLSHPIRMEMLDRARFEVGRKLESTRMLT